MTHDETASRPEDLERLLIERQHAGDVDGMVALYEPQAVLDHGGPNPAVGVGAIRNIFEEHLASGRQYERGHSRPAVVAGELALTSTELPDGDITVEVARRQNDGKWLWVIDRFSVL